jgi:hypothetical protein
MSFFKKKLFVVAISSELITIHKFNTSYFYLKVFGFSFVQLKNSSIFAREYKKQGPFVYRLGRMVFIHVRAVRFRYGLQFTNTILKSLENYFSRLFLLLVLAVRIVDEVRVRYICATYTTSLFFEQTLC